MANSPIVSGLTGYVDQQRLPLIQKLNLGGDTQKYATIQTGVKSVAALNLLTTSIAWGDAKGCGFGADSTQTLSQRNLAVNNFKVEVNYCVRVLLNTWAGYQVSVAKADKLPFEEYFINDVIAKTSEKADTAIWQGANGVGGVQVDGLLALAAADNSVIDVTIPSGTTKYAAIKMMVAAIPAAQLKGEARIFCSPEFLIGYHMEVVDLNLYHFEPGKDLEEIQIPGTNIMLTKAVGLTGASKLFFANKANLFYGVDLEGDAETIDAWYSADNDAVRIRMAFNAGANYAFGDGIVLGDLQ